jgi:hypothetical protein
MRRITLTDHTVLGAGHVRTIEVDFRADGIYEHVWPEGHKTIMICSTDHSEMLIEHAVYAFMERDFRGVINYGASGIDAYLNFHIEVLLLVAGKSVEEVALLIKLIDRQENRRWGAFWALETQFGQGQLPEFVGDMTPVCAKTSRNNGSTAVTGRPTNRAMLRRTFSSRALVKRKTSFR